MGVRRHTKQVDSRTLAEAERLLRGMGVIGDDRLRWAAAVGAVQMLIRRSEDSLWEQWHSEHYGLSDGEMMRANTAMTRLVHSALDLEANTRWVRVAALLTDPQRQLPDGRTLLQYAGPDGLADLQLEVRATGEHLARMQRQLGPRGTAVMTAAMTGVWGNRWFGMPAWPRIVETFVEAVADPAHRHWRGPQNYPAPESRPPLIEDTEELHRLLLAGPDHLDAESADWCIQALLPYVIPDEPAE